MIRSAEGCCAFLWCQHKAESTHAGCKANAHGVYIRLDVLHGVENAETVVNRTPES